MKIKALRFIVIVVFLAVSACSKNTPIADPIGSTPVSSTPVTLPTENSLSNVLQGNTQNSTSEGPKIITFAVPSFFRQTYLPLANQFNAENSDVFVQIVTPTADIQAWMGDDLYTLASAADTSFVFSSQSLSMNASFFLDLSPLLESDSNFNRNDFWPGSLTACENSQGTVLGVPLEVNLTGIAFSKDAFDRAGLSYPVPGWTWADFSTIQEILGKQGLAYLDSQEFFTSILSARLDLVINDQAQLQEVVSPYFLNVQGKTIYPYDEKQTVGERQSLIVEKRPAMWSVPLGTSLDIQQITEQGPVYNKDSRTGFVPYPVDSTFQRTTPAGVRCAMISSGSQHPREAWRWLAFLTNFWLAPQDQGNRLQLIPSRQSTTEKSGYWEKLPDELEPTIRFALDHAWYGPSDPEIFRAANQAIIQSLANGTDFFSEFASLQKIAEAQPTSTPDTRTVILSAIEPVQQQGLNGQIKFFSDSIEANTLTQLAASYQKDHPQIQIDVITDLSQYNFQNIDVENFTTNFDCFTGPSFYGMDDDPAALGKLYTLDAFFQKNSDLSEDFFPGLLEQYRRDGKLVALPAARSLPMLTYNTDLVKQFGITPPKNNWSFNEFLDFLNAVTTNGTTESPYYGYAMVGDRLLLAGRDIRIGNTTPVSSYRFDQVEIVNTATWLSQLVDSREVVRNPLSDPEQVGRLVAAGQVAIWDTSLNGWFFNGSQQSFSTKQIPYPSTAYPVGGSESSAFYISAQAKDPAICWDWINYLSSQSSVSRFWPVRKSIASSQSWQTSVGSENVALFEAVKDQLYPNEPALIEQNALLKIWRDAMEEVYAGVSPQTALTDAQSRANRYFTCLQNATAGTNMPQSELISEQCLSKEE